MNVGLNSMNQEITVKEYTIGQIFSESWRIFKEHFQIIALVTLVVYIPINIIIFLIPLDALMSQEGALRGFRVYMRMIQILEGLIGIIATMAITYIVKVAGDGGSVTLAQAFKKSLSRWPAAIWTSIIAGFFLLGLTLLLVVPGIIYSVYWSFILYVVIVNEKSGLIALKYSKTLVKGRWWKIVGFSSVFALVGFVAVMISGIPNYFLPENIAVTVTTYTFTDIVAAYFTVVSAIFYLNVDATKKIGIA